MVHLAFQWPKNGVRSELMLELYFAHWSHYQGPVQEVLLKWFIKSNLIKMKFWIMRSLTSMTLIYIDLTPAHWDTLPEFSRCMTWLIQMLLCRTGNIFRRIILRHFGWNETQVETGGLSQACLRQASKDFVHLPDRPHFSNFNAPSSDSVHGVNGPSVRPSASVYR